MFLGILSLLEAGSKIYRLPYMNFMIICLQINSFLDCNNKMFDRKHFQIIEVLALTASTLLLYLLAIPGLVATSIITSMIKMSFNTGYHPKNLYAAISLLFVGSLLQTRNALNSPNMLHSVYSTVRQTNLMRSLYMNMKEKSIVESNSNTFNFDTFCHYISVCMIPFFSMSITNKINIFEIATVLLITHSRMVHAYARKGDPSMYIEKYTNSCTWVTALSIDALIKTTPIANFFSNSCIRLGSAAIAYATEPNSTYKKLKIE